MLTYLSFILPRTAGIRSQLLIGVAIGLAATGCPMDEDDSMGADEGGTPTSSMSIGGVVSRPLSTEIAEGNDGIGNLVIAAFAECSLDAEVLGTTAIPNADLSNSQTLLDWTITDLPASPAHLAFFLDDNGDADPNVPLPGPGDLVFADGVGDGILSCVEVEGGDLEIELQLTATVPWP